MITQRRSLLVLLFLICVGHTLNPLLLVLAYSYKESQKSPNAFAKLFCGFHAVYHCARQP